MSNLNVTPGRVATHKYWQPLLFKLAEIIRVTNLNYKCF